MADTGIFDIIGPNMVGPSSSHTAGALRIALLMTADNVGRAVPILADDILVNFDTSRRAGAARALAELARMRQVILFTCHEEVVEALREADPTLNEVEL